MNLEIIKIGKYDPTQHGQFSRYEGYCKSTMQETNPHILPDMKEVLEQKRKLLNGEIVFHSALNRGRDTAAIIAENKPSVVTPQLNEIRFSLQQLVSQSEYEQDGSNLVRKRFVEAFAGDKLDESRNEIEDRLHLGLEIIQAYARPAIAISHSFTMKILEAISRGIPIFTEPEKLEKVLDASQRTYPYGSGFIAALDSHTNLIFQRPTQ